MWCRHCQQEVPAMGISSATGRRCARCHRGAEPSREKLRVDLGSSEESKPTPQPNSAYPPLSETNARRAIDRALRTAQATISAGAATHTLRFDLAQTGLQPERAAKGTSRPSHTASPVAVPRGPSASGQFLAWALAAVGATVLGLGIGFITWSLTGERADLWTPGLIATLTGQGLLIVGLLQIMANLWAAGRQAAYRLGQVHDELRQLRRTTEEAAGRHASSATQFYADVARNAGPEMLVGNLRSQLDQLAARLRSE